MLGVTIPRRMKVTPMPLTDSAIKAAKPKATQYKLHDASGLFLLIRPSGGQALAAQVPVQQKGTTLVSGRIP